MKIITLFLLLMSAVGPVQNQNNSDQGGHSAKMKAIEGLPFCAFIITESMERDARRFYVLVEEQRLNDTDLSSLFRALSSSCPEGEPLEAFVYSDITAFKWLIDGYSMSGAPAEGAKPPARDPHVAPWAYYSRTKDGEVFEYNPDYPAVGRRTVVLKGAAQ